MALYDYQGNTLSTSAYDGKTISILGDSISTYTGYIPSDNEVYYTGSNCGVSSVNDTWWMKLITALGMTLNLNNSWSGSRVTTTNGTSSSAITRATNLGTSPDVIIVYMGINDFNNEVALGTYDGNDDFPTTTTTFREAYAIMLDTILTTYPTSEVWCATLPACERNGDTGVAPEVNGNGVLLDDFNEAIRNLSQVFGAKILDHAQCGLTYENMSTYMGDYSSSALTALHPNASGHSLIANNDIRQMDASVTTRY